MSLDWIAAQVFETQVRLRGFDATDAVVFDRFEDGSLDAALESVSVDSPYALPVVVSSSKAEAALPLPAGRFDLDHLSAENSADFAIHTFMPLIQKNSDTHVAKSLPLAIGLMESLPKFDGVLVHVGMDTQWLQISAQEIVHVNGFVSGRLALGADVPAPTPAFQNAVEDILSKPERLALRLASHDAALIYGALIGAELAATRAFWLGQRIILAGDEGLTKLYEAALTQCGAMVGSLDEEDMTLAGFRHAKAVAMGQGS